MTNTALVDTNLLIYPYDPRDRAKGQMALDLLVTLERRGTGSLSTQVLGEFYVNLARIVRDLGQDVDAEQVVLDLARVWPVHDVGVATVRLALGAARSRQMSYWDALIWATARENGLPLVLSEDFDDRRRIEGVLFRNPFLEGFDLDEALAGE